jgi:hypothetical protein
LVNLVNLVSSHSLLFLILVKLKLRLPDNIFVHPHILSTSCLPSMVKRSKIHCNFTLFLILNEFNGNLIIFWFVLVFYYLSLRLWLKFQPSNKKENALDDKWYEWKMEQRYNGPGKKSYRRQRKTRKNCKTKLESKIPTGEEI